MYICLNTCGTIDHEEFVDTNLLYKIVATLSISAQRCHSTTNYLTVFFLSIYFFLSFLYEKIFLIIMLNIGLVIIPFLWMWG